MSETKNLCDNGGEGNEGNTKKRWGEIDGENKMKDRYTEKTKEERKEKRDGKEKKTLNKKKRRNM